MISPLSNFIVNCICSWISLWQSFKEEFHSSQFAWSSRKRTNTSCKYKYRRVMWVWTFFSLHLIKFQKESWQIQNWLQPVSAHYWLEKTVKTSAKVEMIWTQKPFDLDTKSICPTVRSVRRSIGIWSSENSHVFWNLLLRNEYLWILMNICL